MSDLREALARRLGEMSMVDRYDEELMADVVLGVVHEHAVGTITAEEDEAGGIEALSSEIVPWVGGDGMYADFASGKYIIVALGGSEKP